MKNANTNNQQASNDGTNQPVGGDNNAIIPEEGTNLDSQPAWKQYGDTAEDALTALLAKADNGAEEKKELISRLTAMEDRLNNKEDFILSREEELGRLRQGSQSQEMLKNASERFSEIMEGENPLEKLNAVADVVGWANMAGLTAEKNARNAFYTAIENDGDLNAKSFDWLKHKADIGGVPLDRIGTTKQMKAFLSQVKPQKTVDQNALRESIRKEVEADFKKKNLAIGANIPSGNGQVQGARVDGQDTTDMSESDFLAEAFKGSAKQGFAGI